MTAHPVGYVKPNPPITGHHLVFEGKPEFCEHGVLEGGRRNRVKPCCPTWTYPVMGHAKCECGQVWRARSGNAGKAAHRAHKAELRATPATVPTTTGDPDA